MLNLGQLWLLTLLAPSGAYTTFQKLPIYRVKSTYQGAKFATFSVHIQLTKMNITPLAILGVKWPFSKGRSG